MSTRRKRATVYLDPAIHRALKVKAAETARSVSDIVDNAVRRELAEDEEDLRAFEKRAGEKTVSFEKVLKDLKAHGKI
jgi:plasmid stability protein